MSTAPVPAHDQTRRGGGLPSGLSRWWPAAVLAIGFQLWGVYRVVPPPTEPGLPGLDKVGHLLAFGLPVLLVAVAVCRTGRARGAAPRAERVIGVLVLVSLVHAVVSELVQATFYAHRTGDPYDVLADAVGIGLGALLARRLTRGPERP